MKEPKFGGGLIGSARFPQRYARHDPHSSVPWAEEEEQLPSARTAVTLAILAAILVGLLFELALLK